MIFGVDGWKETLWLLWWKLRRKSCRLEIWVINVISLFSIWKKRSTKKEKGKRADERKREKNHKSIAKKKNIKKVLVRNCYVLEVMFELKSSMGSLSYNRRKMELVHDVGSGWFEVLLELGSSPISRIFSTTLAKYFPPLFHVPSPITSHEWSPLDCY